jgi:hypothetical protein
MLKKVLVMITLSLLLHAVTSVRPAPATTKSDKQSRFTEKVRQAVARLGVGKDATVKVKLQNNSKLEGYVSQASDTHFVVTDRETLRSVPVAYADVTKVKGHNLSTGAKIGIGIAVGFAVTALIIYLIVRPD